jgi:hydroxymethylpyrimidine/phosphomethylpyrimidine kinase
MVDLNQPVVVTIASSDNSGGAGVQMDLHAFGMLRVHGCSVVTGITAQNSTEFRRYEQVSSDIIKAQFNTIAEDFDVVSLKTGMLGLPDAVNFTAGLLRKFVRSRSDMFNGIVIDPILSTTVGGELGDQAGLVDAYKSKLIPLAYILTPNIPEAEALLDRSVDTASDDDLIETLHGLHRLGAQNVLLKGAHSPDTSKGKVTDWLLDKSGNLNRFDSQYIKGQIHGTGCMLSALITAHLALGFTEPYQAVAGSKNILHECIEHTMQKGEGALRYFNTPTCGSWQMFQARVMNMLKEARSDFLKILTPELVPEVGINFGFALPAARTAEEICAFETRVIKTSSGVQSADGVAFGASNHIAKIILSAMSFDLRYRSALNLRYREDILEAAQKLGLTVGTFDRANEPEGVSTMEWGSKFAIEQLGYVPDLIFDKGGPGKEPMIRIIARTPETAVGKVEMIKNALKA